MSMIKIENLSFGYPGGYENVFENMSVQIDTDWKLGFVGRNGRGKTTLLKLLRGEYEYEGRIISSVVFDYFPYSAADGSAPTLTVLREVCPEAEEWELMRELAYLEVETEALERPFNTLSNGEQTKVMLAALFLNEGHFLLIDEPTNHLDMRARELVAKYLKRQKGFLLVSHDRCFLDGCVDHILALNRAGVEVQSGNFSSFLVNFERQMDYERAQNERLKKDIARMQQAAQRTGAWADRVEKSKRAARGGEAPPDRGYVGHRSAKMMKRSKTIEARRQQSAEEKAGLLKNLETAESLKLFPMPYRAETLAAFSEVAVSYGGRTVGTPVSFTVRRGERIALDGRNGSGKSSLLKLLTGEEIAHTGELSVGSGLVISYVAQDTGHLRGSLAEYAEEKGIEESLFKAILQKMDFTKTQFGKDMREFSSGQKKKVLIAASLCERAHLYVWDEPLNFIDIYSRMQIEQIIRDFEPTMLFVEHDRAFRDAVATRTVRLA